MNKLNEFWEENVSKNNRHFMFGENKMLPEVKKRIFNRVKKHLLDKINFDEVDHTMDWGCGGGLFAKEISKHSKLCLMDVSCGSLNNATEYLGDSFNKVVYTKILPNDMNTFKYDGPKVDLIFSNEVIQHFPSLKYFESVINVWEEINPNIISIQVKLDSETKESENYEKLFLNGLRFLENDLIKYFININYSLVDKAYDITKKGDTKLGYYNFKKNV